MTILKRSDLQSRAQPNSARSVGAAKEVRGGGLGKLGTWDYMFCVFYVLKKGSALEALRHMPP